MRGCDNKTTTPIVLAPGDVYVNADFGYKPDAGVAPRIGDRIWFDANANQVGPLTRRAAGHPNGASPA